MTIASAAFAGACGTGDPLWLGDPLAVVLEAGRPTDIRVVFRKNGIAIVSTTFVDDGGSGFRDDFDANLSPSDWAASFTAGAANVFVAGGTLTLETIPNTGCATAQVRGLRTFSVADGTVHFTSRVVDAYVDHSVYGDAQPRARRSSLARTRSFRCEAFDSPYLGRAAHLPPG